MKKEDIEENQRVVYGYIKELWPIAKELVGCTTDEPWKRVLDTANEWTGGRYTPPSDFKLLTAQEQCGYIFEKFLVDLQGVIQHMNKQMMLDDGEDVQYGKDTFRYVPKVRESDG